MERMKRGEREVKGGRAGNENGRRGVRGGKRMEIREGEERESKRTQKGNGRKSARRGLDKGGKYKE